jgi:hypothetical protein
MGIEFKCYIEKMDQICTVKQVDMIKVDSNNSGVKPSCYYAPGVESSLNQKKL